MASAALSLSAQNTTPGSVTDFHGTWNDDNTITLELNAPATGYDAAYNLVDLTSIDRIIIARNHNHQGNETVQNFSHPSPGEHLTWTDTDIEEGGQYVYTATVYLGGRTDSGTSINVSNSQYPASVTGVYAYTNDGQAPVTIGFTAPTITIDGEPLRSLKRIKVERMNPDYSTSSVKSLTNVEPGGSYTVTDSNVETGYAYFYTITAYTNDGQGPSSTADIFVGEDYPTAVSISKAEETANGVRLEWSASNIGQRNGYVSPSSLTFTIKRSHGISQPVTVVSDLRANSYTDASAIDVSEELLYTYSIVASNTVGSSYESMVKVAAGPAAKLPYAEGFDKTFYLGTTFDHETWITDNWVTDKVGNDYSTETNVLPRQGQGLVYIYYNPNSELTREDDLTSGKISLQGATDPQLTFWYYATAGNFDNRLDVEVAPIDGSFTQLANFTISGLSGWQFATVSLKDYCGSDIRLRFRSHKGTHSTIMAIDEVHINDQSAGIQEVEADATGKRTYNLYGQPATRQEGVLLRSDGTKAMIIR